MKTREEIRKAIEEEPPHFTTFIDMPRPDLGQVIGRDTAIDLLPRWWLLRLFEEDE